MKTIWKIYTTDVKRICTNFFALVVAIAVLFLAALYAWANIYSNWDPYGSTSGMKIAAVSLDKGYVDDDGVYQNVGDDVIEDLKESDSIDWQFLDSEEDAITGVENGDYYAALVITEDFTYNMYNVFTEDVSKPQLNWYQNQKKNPVATKISDTVVSNVQTSINEAFVETMTKVVFEDANDLYDDIEEDGGIDGFIEKLEKVSEQIADYEGTIDTIIQGDSVLTAAISEARADSDTMVGNADTATDELSQATTDLKTTEVTLSDYEAEINTQLDSIQNNLASVENLLKQATLSNDAQVMTSTASQCYGYTDDITSELALLEAALGSSYTTVTQNINGQDVEYKNYTYSQEMTTIASLEAQMLTLRSTLEVAANETATSAASYAVSAAESSAASSIQSAIDSVETSQQQLNNELIPSLNQSLKDLESVLVNGTELMHSLSNTLLGMGNVLDSLQLTVNAADTSLVKTRDALDAINGRLTDAIDKVQKASEDDKVQVLVDTLTGDPDIYAEFFSEPVVMETTEVYAVENYGSAVAPFYTILAIWVGGTILVSILKVNVNKEEYPDATMTELFFGRYLLFFTMAQLQNLIIVLGDVFMLGIQCLHPALFWFAGFMAATTFSLIIYSLTVAFGDVGKAAAVVVLVLQIAGSSGTYPIELLPEFFQKVYIFFPFPYVINAMREAIGGLYEMNYVIYLLEECIFIGVALIIGLVIRKPVAPVAEYMDKRMEDTEMM